MDMVTALFQTLDAALLIWGSLEKRKYIDRLEDLKRNYYEEYNKDPLTRSDARLDNIERELRILAVSFAASVGIENSKNKP